MTLDELRRRRDYFARQIKAFQREHGELDLQIRDAESREWIAINNVPADRVQMSNADGVPWFGHVMGFAEWIQAQGQPKPYAEWNGRVYLTADLLVGRMPETPGLAEHVASVRQGQAVGRG